MSRVNIGRFVSLNIRMVSLDTMATVGRKSSAARFISSSSSPCSSKRHHRSLCKTSSCLRLRLVRLPSLADTLEDLLPVLVEFELGDLDFAWCNADGYALAIALLAGDTLDVYDVLEAVDGDDLALTALVGATLDDDLVVLADGNCADLE
jgi:hypothetical protein